MYIFRKRNALRHSVYSCLYERKENMPITEFLERNAQLYKDDVALVEINPELQEKSRVTWREYSLIEQGANGDGRSEITWEDLQSGLPFFQNLPR